MRPLFLLALALALCLTSAASAQYRRPILPPPPPGPPLAIGLGLLPPGVPPIGPAISGAGFGAGFGPFLAVPPPPGLDPTVAPPGAGGWGLRPVPVQPPPGGVTIYRLYNFTSAEPLYTDDFNEVATLVRLGAYRYEGPSFFLAGRNGPGLVPLARMARFSGTHFLSNDPERDNRGRFEKVIGGISLQPAQGLVPLFEWVHPEKDLFLYTTDPRGEIAPNVGYRGPRIIGYVLPAQ